jgi:hypothetical protein
MSRRVAADQGANGRLDAASAFGKSAATGSVTLPVAAHSVPRWKVFMKPTHSIE